MVGETILQLGDLLKQIQVWNSEIEKDSVKQDIKISPPEETDRISL